MGILLLKLIIYSIVKEKGKLENLVKEILYCAENQKYHAKNIPCSSLKKEVLLQLKVNSKGSTFNQLKISNYNNDVRVFWGLSTFYLNVTCQI